MTFHVALSPYSCESSACNITLTVAANGIYSVTTDSPTHFKWKDMKASLEAAGRPHVRLEYVNKAFPDGHASRTIACFAEMLQPGASSAERQETANNIFHVVSHNVSVLGLPALLASCADLSTCRWKAKARR